MDIVERLRDQFDVYDETKLEAADEIERLREEVEHLHKMTVKWSVLQVEGSQENQRLRKALQAVVDAHGTGQGIGAQGVGGWLDLARQALDGK